MCHDALDREESCGGHFREEYQTEEGEAKRNDDKFTYVAAWEYQGVGDNIVMLADGSAEFTKAAGLELDLSGLGMGMRSTRYAMVVDDGTVQHIAIEENPGGLDVSSAEKTLEAL